MSDPIKAEIQASLDAANSRVAELEAKVRELEETESAELASLRAQVETAAQTAGFDGVRVVARSRTPFGKRHVNDGDLLGTVRLAEGVTLLALCGAVVHGRAGTEEIATEAEQIAED